MSKLFSRRDRGKKNSHQGIDFKKKQEEIGGLWYGIFTSIFKVGGEENAMTKGEKKKNHTCFSSKSMYFALILLGI